MRKIYKDKIPRFFSSLSVSRVFYRLDMLIFKLMSFKNKNLWAIHTLLLVKWLCRVIQLHDHWLEVWSLDILYIGCGILCIWIQELCIMADKTFSRIFFMLVNLETQKKTRNTNIFTENISKLVKCII